MQSLNLDNRETQEQIASQPHGPGQRQTEPRVGLEVNSATLYGLALLSVVLLGLLTRLYGLTGYGIWFDEAYHIELVKLPTIAEMLAAVLANPPSDPLYVLLLRPWVELFGQSDGSVRALSVIFSCATLPATYRLGTVVAGRAAGLAGALLLAVSPYAVELGQEAALYALASLTATLALAAGLRWRNSGSRRDGLLYIALGAVAIYSHYVVAAILLLFGLLALHRYAGPRRVAAGSWLAGHAAIVALWSPWLVALLFNWISSPAPRATLQNPATWKQVAGALVQFSSGTASLLQGVRALEVSGLLVGGLLLVAGWLAGRQGERRGLRLIVVVSGLIFLLPAMLSAATGLWLFVPHFMIFLLPSVFVVFGAGIFHFGRHTKLAGSNARNRVLQAVPFALAAIWLVAQVWGLVLYNRYPPHGADGLRELAGVLESRVQPGEKVLVTPPLLEISLARYFSGEVEGVPADFDLRRIYEPYEAARWHSKSVSAVSSLTRGQTRFWLVYRPELDDGGKLLAEIGKQYREVERQSYIFATLYRFEKR